MTVRDDVIRWYATYLDACNRRAWDALPLFLAETTRVNGHRRTRSEYVANVISTTHTFPDYRWEMRRAIVEGEWLAVHLHATGTRVGPFLGAPGDGAAVDTDEFDMYRIVDGVIHEVEGTADNARLCGLDASSGPDRSR